MKVLKRIAKWTVVVGIALFLGIGCNVQPQKSAAANPDAKRVAVGTAPAALALADFNRDGKLDIAVANSGSKNVTVLLGDGKGGFTPATGSPFPAGDNPSDIAVGDVNGDGKLDLAFANHDTDYLTVLTGDGKGGFRPAPGSPFTVQSKPHPHGIALADFNGDGKPDLVTDDWQNDRVTVLFNDGRGGFQSPGTTFPVGKMPYHKLRAADVNNDGKADIVTTNFRGGNVTILLADGQGTFKQPTGSPFEANRQPFGIAIGDLNADGNPDLAVAHYSGHITDTSGDRMSILLGAGDGTFRLSWSQAVPGKAPTSVAVGDVNGDGILDAVFGNYANSSVTVVLGSRRDFTIAPGSPISVGSHPSSVAVGDLNGDGKADIVTTNEQDNDISILLTK
jgi:FG-GAP-like repeat